MIGLSRHATIGAAVGAATAVLWAWLGFGAILLIVVLATLGGLIGHLTDEARSSDGSRRLGGRR